jgi:hypothetical protein
MYQYTTTNIINSALDSNGTTAKFTGSATALDIKRVNKFLVSGITSITKRPYTAGVKETATIVVPVLTANKVARLTIDIRLEQSTNTEYANTHLDFRKPVVVEVIATGTAGTDATALLAQLNSLKNRFGYNYFTATLDTATITIVAKDNNQRFYSIVLAEETANTSSITQFDYVSKATGTVTVAGKLGFGDDEWMIKSIYIPTVENTRYFGISKDERPVIGGNYTQYTIKYVVAKDHEDGIVGGGNSITTHVFYVLSTLVTSFEAQLTAASLAFDTIGVAVSAVTIGGNTYDLSDATAIQLTATTTPSGVTGGVWTLTGDDTVAGTLDSTKVTLTPGGLFSLASGHGLANADTLGVQVVIDGFTKTGDITIQT